MGGVSFVARLALELTSPDGPRFGGNVGDGSQADYTLWPFGSILAPINPGFIEAAESDSQPSLPDGGAPAPVPTVLIAAPTATTTPPPVTAEPSPSPSATVAPSATATATVMASPTRTTAPLQAPTMAILPTSTAAPRPTSTPAQASATPVTRPEDQPPAPPAPTSTPPRPTNTAAPTNTPPPVSTPLPTSTPRPTDNPPIVGTPTSTPLPTSTPEPPLPSLSFADEAITASEAQGEATFEVRLSGSYFRPVTVAYSTNDGSATAGADYMATSGTLTFSPGQVAKTIKITLRSDGRNEPNETMTVRLSGIGNAILGGSDTAVLTITDSDAPPTVSFVGSGRTVAESGGSTAFTVELSQVSDLAVAVPYTVGGTASVGDTSLGTGDHNLRAGVVVIPAGSTSARVRFAIISDLIDEDDESVQINLGTPLNADLVSPTTYVVRITDDDTAGVRLSRNSFSLDEGQGDTYTVTLESEPTHQVAVQIRPDGQLGADRSELSFTPLNWSRPQTVTLTALDDDVDEADPHLGQLGHVVVSADPRYNRIDLKASLAITATIGDDDTAGVLVGATTPLTITESPGVNHTATYTVALQSQPTAPVTITLGPDVQVGVSPNLLVFDAASWRTPQSVMITAVDDAYDESDPHTGQITHTVASGDPIYAGQTAADVSVNISDDDTAGLAIAPGDLALSELAPNQVGTYTVTLTSRPRSPVTVSLTVTDSAQLSFAPADLLFDIDETSWSTPQTVTVTATQDLIDEGPDDTPHVRLIEHRAASPDPDFNGLGPVTKTVALGDDDTARIVIEPVALTVAEGATTAYTVTLTSEPTSAVTLDLTSAPAGLITPSLTSLVFTRNDWTVPQTVTVQAGDDDVIDGAETATITHTVRADSDPIYLALGPQLLGLTVTDNDVAGLAFTGAVSITEGLPETYGVALSSRPTADVTVTLSLPAATVADTTTLVFSPTSWNIPQIVTVIAEDDAIASGDRTAPIIHTLSSADANFNASGPFTHTLSVLEDDTAGLQIGDATPPTVSEDPALGNTATFTVALTSQPTATVTLILTHDDQLVVTATALVFDPTNWSVPQTVTVTAENDLIAETTPHTGTIQLSSTSEDPLYNRAWPDYTLPIEDDDPATVVVPAPASFGASASGPATSFSTRPPLIAMRA